MLCTQAVQAQSYRCVGDDGKRYYGQTVPSQCNGRVVEQLSPQGTVMKRIDPQLKAPQSAARTTAAPVSKDVARRDSALLATYSS